MAQIERYKEMVSKLERSNAEQTEKCLEVIRQNVKLTKKVAHLENKIKEEVENHA